ncbi:MAG TPA: tetratricopeptide repeat protein [Pyrinomonadaceae bacterium]|nr:tetratricopeptide repeat protein [Pyrinomonadaceae bacterium]
MSKNLLYCSLGLVLGLVIGFFVTNPLTRPGAQTLRQPAAATTDAGPLDAEQAGGELPPGHPDIGGADTPGAGGGTGTAASTSAEAQGAMDRADRDPKDFKAQKEAGEVFYGLHDYEKASLYFGRALALKADDFATLVAAGNARYDAGDFAAAAPLYERALALRPDSADVRTDYGNTFFQRQDYARALAEYRKSVAVDPTHVNSWRNLAVAAINLNDKAAASEALEKLAALTPQSPQVETLRQKLAELP